MKKILVLAGSNSATSINRALATYASSFITDGTPTALDLNDYEMPLYSPEREASSSIPETAKQFVQQIENADAVILALAEHNGSYSAAFKNVLDWASRHKQKLWSEKPMLLLSTSPGARGGASVMAAAQQTFPHLGAQIKASFSLPSFYENFAADTGITDVTLDSQLKAVVTQLNASL